jgi:hypothetical protein
MFAPSSGHRIAAFRILFALYMIGYLAAMLPHVTVLFSDQGVYVPYLLPDLAPPPAIAWLLFVAMIAATLSLLVGFHSNLSAACLLLLFAHHYFLQLAIKQSSFDRLIAIYMLVLCFADAGYVWSVDARRGKPGRPPTVWAERLVAFQSIVLYFGAGLWKLANPRWHGGAMMWFTLQGMFATPVAFSLVQLGLPESFWTALTAGIIAAEMLLGVALLVPRARPWAIVAGTLFHVGNCVILDIPEFLISLAPYAVFIEASTLQRWGAKLRLSGPRPDSAS